LFAEEYEFVVRNMGLAISLDDPEIVGEFIQCLKIMQVTKASDPEIWVFIEKGCEYLVTKEQERGGKGLWVPERDGLYNRYHSSYCSAIGLLDYHFMVNDRLRLNPSKPRLLTLLDNTILHHD